MLVHTQRSSKAPVFSARTQKLNTHILNNSNKALTFLFSPADTSANESQAMLPIAKSHRINIPGKLKTIFWILLSITIALLIGRLN